MSSTEIVRWHEDDEINAFYSKLALEAVLVENEGGEGFADEIIRNVLAAETEEDILDAGDVGTLATKEFINTPFRLRDDHMEVRKSTLTDEDGKKKNPFFLLMDVTEIATGEDVTLNCGARTVMTQFVSLRDSGVLKRYEDEGGMPLVITTKSTKGGNEVLVLRKYKAQKRTTIRGRADADPSF